MADADTRIRFEQPLYSASDAARHIGVPRSTFDTWLRGYSRKQAGRSPVSGAQIVTHIPASLRGAPTVPFIGLAEGYVLAAFRQAGVPLQRIRPAIDRLQKDLGIAHVLASKSLYTDGAEVLYDYAERAGDTPEGKSARELVVVRNNQRVFHEVVADYLQRIEFGSDDWAELIHLPQYRTADVVVDPGRSFGIPIFASGGARVEVVLNRFKAGESIDALTDEFGIPADELFDALRVHLDAAA
jgi:uncharacterized protein (DUF433 family)